MLVIQCYYRPSMDNNTSVFYHSWRVLEKSHEEKQHISEDEIPQLLEPMKKKCLYNNKGWWTYEVCFGKGIYQYHNEANEVVGDKISLGLFSKETDWSQEKIDTKIYCDEGSADLVFRVDEPSSCSYVITVYTNKLCQHSLFRSSPAQKPQAITCSLHCRKNATRCMSKELNQGKKLKKQPKQPSVGLRKQELQLKSKVKMKQNWTRKSALTKQSKSSKRSQVWPWENPGVESDDEVWIDGNIEQDQLGVHRLDITKGRKTSANGEHAMHEGITITSQTMHRKREPASQRQKGDTEETGQGHTDDNLKESSEHEEEQEQSTDQTASEREESKGGTDQDADETATEKTMSRKAKEKKLHQEMMEKRRVLNQVRHQRNQQADREGRNWNRTSSNPFHFCVLIFLTVLDQKFEEKLGSVPRKDGVKDHIESHTERHSESHAESHSESPVGVTVKVTVKSHAESHSESPGGSHGESHGESHSESHGEKSQ
ncbi:Protein OS-9 [Desmophyllum pertusum]|uniref:Protein OS-9 n=1 Tax=Desmophyllum pertusum TaxID=174260 RepID=A0A9X0A1M3_9CNID|nr:Protein OS-9 [Desmophyllum pertusum]